MGKKASVFVSVNTTSILFQTLVQEWEDQSPSEDFMLTCHQVLARLGPKGKKYLKVIENANAMEKAHSFMYSAYEMVHVTHLLF